MRRASKHGRFFGLLGSATPDDGRWDGIGCSVRGAGHIKRNQPNQDRLLWRRKTSPSTLILAIADGHGSERHFRSDQGAALAVEMATELVAQFFDHLDDPSDIETIERQARELLPSAIETSWKSAVDRHLASEEGQWFLSDDEAREVVDDPDRFIAYGSTLLAVAATPSSLLFLQLGDGDILKVDRDGKITRPIPPDPLLSGNTTTSLCMPDSAGHMQVCCHAAEEAPAMILVATDGYANSFRDDAAFFTAASDYLAMLREHGSDWVAGQLPAWLEETTRDGSGDDITLGLMMPVEIG
jgi:hypothetical protein